MTTSLGTLQSGQTAKNILRMKNGDQQRTNVKKTMPRTLEAFCSVATALADMCFRFTLLASNLKIKKIILIKVKEKNI